MFLLTIFEIFSRRPNIKQRYFQEAYGRHIGTQIKKVYSKLAPDDIFWSEKGSLLVAVKHKLNCVLFTSIIILTGLNMAVYCVRQEMILV